MNTLVIVGLVAIGLGLLVIVAAAVVIFVAPGHRAPADPEPSAAPRTAPAGQAPALPASRAPVVMGTTTEADALPSLSPSPVPEEEDPNLVNTGVLNVKDFDDFEKLLAAADARAKRKEPRD